MATNPFRVDPHNGIFRAVINGDNAASPSSPSNVVFDAFAGAYQGVFAAGVVPLSAMSSSTVGSTTTWTHTVSFGKTFANPPQLLCLAQRSSGVWTSQFTSGNAALGSSYQITDDSTISNGVSGTGAGCYAWGYTTTTGVVLGATQHVYSGSGSVAPPPANWSYRVFQI